MVREEIPMSQNQLRTLKTLSLGVLIELKDDNQLERRIIKKQDAHRLAQMLNQYLVSAYPELDKVSVLIIGAIYDQSQVIRAGFPIYEALADIAHSAAKGHDFVAQCISVGGDQNFSVPTLNPLPLRTSPLLILPMLLVGQDEDIAHLTHLLEAELMQSIQMNADVENLVNQLFGIKINNMSMSTLADMVGMLASQLIQIGLEPIWHLMKSAIFNSEFDYLACLDTGQRLLWDAGQKQVRLFGCNREIYAQSDQAKSQSFEQYQQINDRIYSLLSQYNIGCLPLVFNQVSFLNIQPKLNVAQQYIEAQFNKL